MTLPRQAYREKGEFFFFCLLYLIAASAVRLRIVLLPCNMCTLTDSDGGWSPARSQRTPLFEPYCAARYTASLSMSRIFPSLSNALRKLLKNCVVRVRRELVVRELA